tara:strand:+ start:474 stop:650 length:177 start_codon:yes stop_codon:yes gene_type:complete
MATPPPAKEIIRRVYKINNPQETKTEVETLVPYIYKAEGRKTKEIDCNELLMTMLETM